jgi:nitroreductase
MDALDAIHTRRSIRKYLDTPVPQDILQQVLSSAMYAPSACNQQPWQFVVLDDRKLLRDRGLAQVFLFGERQSALKVQQVQGAAAANVTLGGSDEATTTTDQERAKREAEFPSWTSAEFAYRGSHWLFIINSANASAAFTVSGWPSGSGGEDAFTGKAIEGQNGSSRHLNLPAYGVAGLRFRLAGPAEQNK